MRIILTANEFVEYGKPKTGFPNYLYRVACALQKSGNEVIIVTCGNRTAHRYMDGIEVWEVVMHYYNSAYKEINVIVNNIRSSRRINRKIKEIAKSRKIDVIQFTSLFAQSLLYTGKIPSVMRLSSYAKKAYPTFETLSEKTVKTMSFFEIAAGKRCNAVFAPSEITAKAYEKDFRKKVHIIESPFINDVKRYDDRIMRQQLSDKKYVLFFGNLYYEKGILVIAEIIQRFLKDNPAYVWVFAGRSLDIKGTSAAKILSMAAGDYKDKVIFLGELPHEQLYPVIRNSDFVVLPSIMENLSNACIEAMYFSKIVIGTDGASFEQLIQNNVSGLLCKIGDSQDLLDKMEKVVRMSAKDREKMEKKAHERIERLRPEVVVKQLLRFYEQVIERTN
ncbi:MAG: glycosyltransferase family 4 protein [Kineothrix sp.]|nr:glycosyltransferase family 4 protein [Kineothrix sp.]